MPLRVAVAFVIWARTLTWRCVEERHLALLRGDPRLEGLLAREGVREVVGRGDGRAEHADEQGQTVSRGPPRGTGWLAGVGREQAATAAARADPRGRNRAEREEACQRTSGASPREPVPPNRAADHVS